MWLYVPGTSSASAQASEDLNSASCSPSDIGERMGAVYVTWRGKQQQPQAWSRRWKQGGFIRRLSGLTCEPSTLDHGVASFISSLRAIPAKTTALPESGQGQTESDSLPQKSPALPKSAGLILSSARTCRGMQTDSLQPSLRHWKGWATALRQEYSARPPLATPCGASDCSSWPSPKASDPEKAGPNMRGSKGDVPLPGLAVNWEAPSVAVTDGTRLSRGGDRSDELLLTGQAVEATEQWIAPMASGDGQKVTSVAHQKMLCNQAAAFHPPSSPAQSTAGGSMSSTDSQNSNQPSVKRKLNPIFVEALMRWPTGLSGFERQEMAWTRWWLLMPSFLSALYSVSKVEEQMELFGAAA